MEPALSTPIAEGRTAELYPWTDGTILKLYRDWCPPNWIEYELRIATIVMQAGIPSPQAYEIVEVNGRRGLVYEKLDGVSMLQEMVHRPVRLVGFARTLADLHAVVHGCKVPDLPEWHTSLEHSLQRAPLISEGTRQAALHTLQKLPKGDRLCHGDFHPDNILMTSKGPVIIDWMTASRGNPVADVARTHLLLNLGRPTGNPAAILLLLFGRQVFYQTYIRRYASRSGLDQEQLQAWIPVMAAARLNENIANEQQALLEIAGRINH